jgi:hypothetical protein
MLPLWPTNTSRLLCHANGALPVVNGVLLSGCDAWLQKLHLDNVLLPPAAAVPPAATACHQQASLRHMHADMSATSKPTALLFT